MVVYIEDKKQKELISSTILADLPDWFGLPDSTAEYVRCSQELPFWAEIENDTAKGFITLKGTSSDTAEIYVMGVLKSIHNNGVEKKLFEAFYSYAKEHGYSFIQVKTFDLKDEAGFVCYDRDKVIGLITYRISNNRCEILSLNSNTENQGIGTALIEKVKEYAKINNCSILHTITTNDNLRAIGFFQKRGFHLAKLYVNAMDNVRKIKPEVPVKGDNNIPLNDELEFEMNI